MTSERPHRHHYDAEMLSVEEARDRILSYFTVLPDEERPLLEALGQVLAEDLRAEFDIPALPNSAMDGYAVRSQDLASASHDGPVELPVIGAVAAGQVPSAPVAPWSAVRIMTGAPLPDGADAVVPFEDTDEQERRRWSGMDAINIKVPPRPGDNVRPAGEDLKAGSLALDRGCVLRPGQIGVAASLGRSSVRVIRRPVVAIISTGDELIEPGEPPQPGKIYDSNAYSVAASVLRYGGVPRLAGTARDTVQSLNAAISGALDADLVITSAGVSRGDYDVVKDVLAERGAIALWSVRMRPAKPLAFGALNGPDGRKVPHLGLPGNPVSALVACEQFCRPAIRLMMGKPVLDRPRVQATLDEPITNHDGRRVYARVIVYADPHGDGYRARLAGSQSSGALSSMAAANGLAICPDDVARIEAGQMALVEMLDWPEEVF